MTPGTSAALRAGQRASLAMHKMFASPVKPFTVITHPVVQHNLTRLRDERTGSEEFRRLLGEIAALLIYEATRMRMVNLIAAPEGIRHVGRFFSSVPIFTASVDRKLNRRGFIVPGLGDAGDRLFGT
jgi:uracil phosphoribosyltransferase